MFNNILRMRDLFQNPSMAKIFPQFEKGDKLQNVYSFEWVDRKVKQYIKNALNAEIIDGEIIVVGKKSSTLKKIRSMKWTIEAFFNNMPSIVKNIRKNTRIYTPFTNLQQLKELKTEEQKLAALNIVLDNINYNPDLESLNSVKLYGTNMSFFDRQMLWVKRVDYRRINE